MFQKKCKKIFCRQILAKDYANICYQYFYYFVSLIGYFVLVLFILIKKWYVDWKQKWQVMIPIGIGILALGELLIVSPIGGRTFYLPYICFVIGGMNLFAFQIDNQKQKIKQTVEYYGKLILFTFCFVFVLTSRENHYADKVRTQYVEEMLSRGETVIEYPLLPHQINVYNDGTVHNALDMFYHREKQGDIQFKIREWEDWTVENIDWITNKR